MAIDFKDITSRAITLGVEGALSTAKRLERVSRGMSAVYNMIADAVPVPLPRLGSDRSAFNPPTYQYKAPSTPPSTAHTPPMAADSPKKTTVDLNIVEVKSTPAPAAKKAKGGASGGFDGSEFSFDFVPVVPRQPEAAPPARRAAAGGGVAQAARSVRCRSSCARPPRGRVA